MIFEMEVAAASVQGGFEDQFFAGPSGAALHGDAVDEVGAFGAVGDDAEGNALDGVVHAGDRGRHREEISRVGDFDEEFFCGRAEDFAFGEIGFPSAGKVWGHGDFRVARISRERIARRLLWRGIQGRGNRRSGSEDRRALRW